MLGHLDRPSVLELFKLNLVTRAEVRISLGIDVDPAKESVAETHAKMYGEAIDVLANQERLVQPFRKEIDQLNQQLKEATDKLALASKGTKFRVGDCALITYGNFKGYCVEIDQIYFVPKAEQSIDSVLYHFKPFSDSCTVYLGNESYLEKFKGTYQIGDVVHYLGHDCKIIDMTQVAATKPDKPHTTPGSMLTLRRLDNWINIGGLIPAALVVMVYRET